MKPFWVAPDALSLIAVSIGLLGSKNTHIDQLFAFTSVLADDNTTLTTFENAQESVVGSTFMKRCDLTSALFTVISFFISH